MFILSVHGGLRRPDRAERIATGCDHVVLNGKDRQHCIADEFKDLAPIRLDRVAHRAEILIKQFDQLVTWQAFGQAGEPAQVGKPDHGTDRLAHAAPDLSRENPAARLAADIGVEKRARHAPQRLDLQV